jgi:hypothetical protein
MREISPELVLVDPELAQIERLRLAEDAVARSATPVRVIPPPAAGPPRLTRVATSARRAGARTMPTLLLLSLLINLLFAASLFAGDSNAPTLETAPPASSPPPASTQLTLTTKTTTKNLETTPAAKPKPSSHPFAPAAKADAERAVLSLVSTRAANGNAPKALVDPTTGLLRNNVLAVCHPGSGRSFTCVVHPPQDRPRGGLYVRYWPAADGRPQRVAWLGYRLSG